MADIDFLTSAKDDKKEDDKEKKTGVPPDNMAMHVPKASMEVQKKAVPKPEKRGFLDGIKGLFGKKKGAVSEGVLDQKLEQKHTNKEKKPSEPKQPSPLKPPNIPPPKPPMSIPTPPPTPPKPPSAPSSQTPPLKPPPKYVNPPSPPEKPKKPELSKVEKPPKSKANHEPVAEKDEAGTLRVSLITTEEGTSLTELTIRDRFRTFFIVLILAVVADGLIFGGILYYKSKVATRIQGIEEGVMDLDKEIANAERKVIPAQNFQKLTKLGNDLLDVHMHWTNLLKLIEDRAVSQVQFMNLSGAESGTISSNILAKDFTTLGRQLVALREDERVSDASITTATADFGEEGLIRGARAGLTIIVNPKIFFNGE